MEFLSSPSAEEHLPQQRPATDASGDVEFALPLDRDIEGCWRRVVLRALLGMLAGEMASDVVRAGGDGATTSERQPATDCEEEETMISRAAVFMRKKLKDSKSVKCFASPRDCRTCLKCGLR